MDKFLFDNASLICEKDKINIEVLCWIMAQFEQKMRNNFEGDICKNVIE